MTALLLLLSCSRTTGEATPWSYEPAEPRAPSVDADDLGRAMQTWLPAMRSVDVTPLFAAWDDTAAHADGACPLQETADDTYATYHIWYTEGCTTEDGSQFQGYAQRYDEVGEDDGWAVTTATLYGVAAVVTPAGDIWQANGYAAWAEGWREVADPPTTEHYVQHVLAGDFTWTGESADGTWLTSPLRHDGGWYLYEQPGAGGYVYLNATLSGDLGQFTALAASEFALLTPNWSPCGAPEPQGTLSLRDHDGGWYDVIFHGDSEDSSISCDGCGDLWFEGARFGEVCVDLTDLVADLHP